MTEEKTTFRKGLAHGSPVMPNNREKFAEDTRNRADAAATLEGGE